MASSEGDEGRSVKRTDFEGFGESLVVERFMNEEDEGMRGRVSFAWAKSEERAGSLGWLTDDVDFVGNPRNWDVRSSYWPLNRDAVSSLSPDCDCWLSKASMPSRIESRDREMWPSWELGSRLREMARWRSSRESLIWSARR